MSNLLKNLFEEYEKREQRGLSKYGTTMDRMDLELKDWVQHALEEAMDLSIYLTKIKQILNEPQGYADNKKTNI